MKKFTIPNLKKQLAEKTKEELIQEIAMLCQTFPQVKEYYQGQSDDIQKIVKKYKDIIEKEFIEGKTRGLPKARLAVARKAVNEFKRLTTDPERLADVMLTYVESISWFNTEYGPDDEDFYTYPVDMLDQVLPLLAKHQLLDKFEPRIYAMVQNATDGWGYQDSLEERYEEVYGRFDE
jgi:hypothetical protein